MQDKILELKAQVSEAASNQDFVHHKWFVEWHLEIVEKIAFELLEFYPKADKDVVEVMAWMHDYGKMLDFDNQYQVTLTKGKELLLGLGFAEDFVKIVIDNLELLDRKMEVDLQSAPIEVQIVSSADGCSHMVGPFIHLFWNFETDKTFKGKSLEELMELNIKKTEKDWSRKIVLPEARKAFEGRYKYIQEQSGNLPEKFLNY